MIITVFLGKSFSLFQTLHIYVEHRFFKETLVIVWKTIFLLFPELAVLL
ncbi:hypothetical protein CUZ95_2368 [Enterococcus lactis]|nr:hypothetical protein [Enterococcus lactis]